MLKSFIEVFSKPYLNRCCVIPHAYIIQNSPGSNDFCFFSDQAGLTCTTHFHWALQHIGLRICQSESGSNGGKLTRAPWFPLDQLSTHFGQCCMGQCVCQLVPGCVNFLPQTTHTLWFPFSHSHMDRIRVSSAQCWEQIKAQADIGHPLNLRGRLCPWGRVSNAIVRIVRTRRMPVLFTSHSQHRRGEIPPAYPGSVAEVLFSQRQHLSFSQVHCKRPGTGQFEWNGCLFCFNYAGCTVPFLHGSHSEGELWVPGCGRHGENHGNNHEHPANRNRQMYIFLSCSALV